MHARLVLLPTQKHMRWLHVAGSRHQGPGLLTGWMYKRGRVNTNWKRRFFVLYTSTPPRPRLYYFTSDRGARRMAEEGQDTAQGYIELDRVIAVQVNIGRGLGETRGEWTPEA